MDILGSVVDPDPHGSRTFAWIQNFCMDPELKFRIRIQLQQKVKEHINKTVNSGMFIEQ